MEFGSFFNSLLTRQHKLKILENYADDVCCGYKTFEIRKNDRCFQKGDILRFVCVDSFGRELEHVINQKDYIITYVFSGFGLKKGYVILSFVECED